MSTFRQIYYQIVFSTKNRESSICIQYEQELYKYVWGIINNLKCKLYRISSMPDHIHIFSDLHPTICLAGYVKSIKVASNTWMKESGKFPKFNGWQDGYGAFTYCIKEKDMIIDYIKKQKEHHRKETFLDEYRHLLKENGIEFDEKYLL
jgi:putative transposase